MYLLYTSMYKYVPVCTHVEHDKVCDEQANSKQSTRCVCLDINLLTPSRIEFKFPAQDSVPHLALPHGHPSCSSPNWLEYVFRTSHPVLRWLLMKLAEWIGENLQGALGFPDKADRGASPGTGWTTSKLNHVLQQHVFVGSLTTFGCVEWESELFRGVIRARCYPFKMPKGASMASIHRYIAVHTSMYWYILVHSIYKPVHTSTYWYIPVHTVKYFFIPVHHCPKWRILT
jgi:hypothetical protein